MSTDKTTATNIQESSIPAVPSSTKLTQDIPANTVNENNNNNDNSNNNNSTGTSQNTELVAATTTTTNTESPPTVDNKDNKSPRKSTTQPSQSTSVTSSPLQPSQPYLDWDAYLTKTGSKAAAANCFAQWPDPPRNSFRVDHKLETMDPRNQSSRCIATVIECQGPRVRLRLDGTDDRNDFWLMCDSDLLTPWNPAHAHGRHISPPLGFGAEISRWQKFMHKIIEITPPEQFASESDFHPPPPRPTRNEFIVGDKLEAVDPKNPSLICPATVREMKGDRLLIGFDGWSLSSQFWTNFYSRDLFPCGWCQRAGHTLQPPGSLDDHHANNLSASVSFIATGGGSRKSIAAIHVTPKPEATIPTVSNTSSSSKKQAIVSNRKKQQPLIEKKTPVSADKPRQANAAKPTASASNTPILTNGNKRDKLVRSATKPVTGKQTNKTITTDDSPPPPQLNSSNNSSSLSVSLDTSNLAATNKSPRSTHNSNKTETPSEPTPAVMKPIEQQPVVVAAAKKTVKKTQAKSQAVELSESVIRAVVVKNEPTDVDENGRRSVNGNTIEVGSDTTTNVSVAARPVQVQPKVIVYLDPNGDCGPHVITSKFHRSHKKFGPGPVACVYKSIVQSMIDDAVDPQTVFGMVPIGNSSESVRVKTKTFRDKKCLVQVNTEKELWHEIDRLCKNLDIVTNQLFSATLPPENSTQTASVPTPSTTTTTNTGNVSIPLNNIENLNTNDKQSKQAAAAAAALSKQPVPVSSSSSMSSTTTSLVNLETNNLAQTVSSQLINGSGRSHTPKRKHHNDSQSTAVTVAASSAVTVNGSNGFGQQFHYYHDGDYRNSISPDHHIPAKIKKTGVEMTKAYEWSVDQVVAYVADLCDAFFIDHVDMFRHHEIDGKALLLLTTDVLMKYMGFKLGPALKLNNYLDKLRQANNIPPRPNLASATATVNNTATALGAVGK